MTIDQFMLFSKTVTLYGKGTVNYNGEQDLRIIYLKRGGVLPPALFKEIADEVIKWVSSNMIQVRLRGTVMKPEAGIEVGGAAVEFMKTIGSELADFVDRARQWEKAREKEGK